MSSAAADPFFGLVFDATETDFSSTPHNDRDDSNITGNRSYTRAHFLYYAGAVQPGIYR